MLKNYSINIIGCGRLGQTIAWLLNEYVNINCILNQTLASAKKATNFTHAGIPISEYYELTPANIYLIATKDDHIETVCKKLVATQILVPGDIVFHCSGSLSSDILSSVQQAGALTASLHPNRSFADPATSITEFNGTFCAIEGQAEAVTILTGLFESIGAHVFTINKEFKNLYHAAGCIASNYLVTLSYIASTCYQQADVPEETAKQIVNGLMNSTLHNLTQLSHTQALTGPIARGDIKTIAHHMAVLPDKIREIYSILGKQTIALTKHGMQEQILNVLEQ